MEKNNVSLELEEMRLQMAALQKQLNERLKLDEQQLQNSTMKKINAINRYGYFELIGLIVAIICYSIVQYRFHISFEFITCTLLIIVLTSLFGFWLANRIKNTDLSKKSTKEIIRTLISMKKQYQIYNIIGFIIGFFIILPWMLYEIYVDKDCISKAILTKSGDKTSFICCGFEEFNPERRFDAVVFVASCEPTSNIGIIFCIKMYKKQLSNITEMIEILKDQE